MRRAQDDQIEDGEFIDDTKEDDVANDEGLDEEDELDDEEEEESSAPTLLFHLRRTSMNQNDKTQEKQTTGTGNQQGFDKDQPAEQAGQPNRDRSRADDRGQQGISNRPKYQEQVIPDLDEPDVEGVGNEGRDQSQGERPITDNKAGG